MDDETFEKLMDEAQKQHFTTEEDAKVYFDDKLKEFSRLKMRKRKVAPDEREAADPYYAMMKEEREIASRFVNHFDLDDEDYHAYLDNDERNIGRYPEGFRHYENYENYKTANPQSSIQDYHEESKIIPILLII